MQPQSFTVTSQLDRYDGKFTDVSSSPSIQLSLPHYSFWFFEQKAAMYS